MPATQTTETDKPVSNTKQISRKEMSLKQYEASIREELMSISTLLQNGVEDAYKMTRKLLAKGSSVEEIAELTALPIDEIEWLATHPSEMVGSLSEGEAARMRYEARQLYIMDELARLDASRKEGIALGIAEVLLENKRELACKALCLGLSVEQAAKATELSFEEVKNLKLQDSLCHAG